MLSQQANSSLTEPGAAAGTEWVALAQGQLVPVPAGVAALPPTPHCACPLRAALLAAGAPIGPGRSESLALAWSPRLARRPVWPWLVASGAAHVSGIQPPSPRLPSLWAGAAPAPPSRSLTVRFPHVLTHVPSPLRTCSG